MFMFLLFVGKKERAVNKEKMGWGFKKRED